MDFNRKGMLWIIFKYVICILFSWSHMGFTISPHFFISYSFLWSYQTRLSSPSAFMSSNEANLKSPMQAMADVLEPLLPMICGYCPVTGDTWISFGWVLIENERMNAKYHDDEKSLFFLFAMLFRAGYWKVINQSNTHRENSTSREFVVVLHPTLHVRLSIFGIRPWHWFMAYCFPVWFSSAGIFVGRWFDDFDSFCIWWYWCCASNVTWNAFCKKNS